MNILKLLLLTTPLLIPLGAHAWWWDIEKDSSDGSFLATHQTSSKSKTFTNHDNEKVERKTKLYPSGEVYSQKDYTDGRVNGQVKHFYRNGQLMEEYVYSFGQPKGPSISYYKNGIIKSRATYKNGDLEGDYVTYDPKGDETYRAIYINHKPVSKHGLQPIYNQFGRVQSYTKWEFDKLIQKGLPLQ
jgi:antitoxin component YwqK of YwqJK toxin-antitoxin module